MFNRKNTPQSFFPSIRDLGRGYRRFVDIPVALSEDMKANASELSLLLKGIRGFSNPSLFMEYRNVLREIAFERREKSCVHIQEMVNAHKRGLVVVASRSLGQYVSSEMGFGALGSWIAAGNLFSLLQEFNEGKRQFLVVQDRFCSGYSLQNATDLVYIEATDSVIHLIQMEHRIIRGQIRAEQRVSFLLDNAGVEREWYDALLDQEAEHDGRLRALLQ